MAGIKHLIECHCVLKIYDTSDIENIIYHKFPVYTKFDSDGKVISKLVKCNNCDALHKIIDICRSELSPGKDQTQININKEDIELMLSDRLCNVLAKYNCDMSIWEHAHDIIDNSEWGNSIVIKRDIIDEQQHVKILFILGENKFKIENKVINDLIYLEG